MKLLKTLCEIQAPSGHEAPLKDFLMSYVMEHCKKWSVQPEIIQGDDFQDCFILKFGRPRTCIFAHMDTIGYTVRYFNQLLPIGSPDAGPGTLLVGSDSLGPIECKLEIDKDNRAHYKFGRPIERGTVLTYKVRFHQSQAYVESAYLDNRLGVYCALKVAEAMTDGAIAFSCWEEHGGGSVPYLAKYIHEALGIRQALISDITWTSDGVEPGKGVVVSMRDRNIPRRSFINRVIEVAQRHHLHFQLEVEGAGSSDGGELQRSPYPFDWCFVGAPSRDPHSPHEKVHKDDIESMIALYLALMEDL